MFYWWASVLTIWRNNNKTSHDVCTYIHQLTLLWQYCYFFQKNKETFTVHVGKYSLSMDLELCTHIELKRILRNDTFYGRATEIT